MNIRVITASAGSGKTFRLTQELDDAIASGRAKPGNVVATTFTTQAAAELIERARSRLLQGGRGRAAHELLAARIGTVNAVCGTLVVEFAFELGLSPAVRVLDEPAAEIEFRRALERVVPEERAAELDGFREKFDKEREWRTEVHEIVEAARSNGLSAGNLAQSADRSLRELDACLGRVTSEDLDTLLSEAIHDAVGAIENNGDETKGTADYLRLLRSSALDLASARGLSWGGWATLAKEAPTKKSLEHASTVQSIAHQHRHHPRLRQDLHRLIQLQFQIAAESLAAYQEHKRVEGVVDFIDQETLALELLRRVDVRAMLAGQIDLFLVDEFQDTSPIQLAVFLEIASLANESIWVGDPKQAIFGFRGTDPALMDAAVESLTSRTSDPDLVALAVDTIGKRALEPLGTSYRSRRRLVDVTSEIFARAFGSQGMPEERTRLVAHLQDEPSGLGEVLEYWPIEKVAGEDNAEGRAMAVATGVRDLLARNPAVKVRGRDEVIAVRPRDLAVLCRTNKQCQTVADSLAALGVAAVVPRMGLLATVEARIVLAGLALWVDPTDSLAAAELARIITYPEELDDFVVRVLDAPGRDAFAADPTVVAVLAERAADRDLGPVAALDAVVGATELHSLCAAWGDTAQRLANLDALRACAYAYASGRGTRGGAATISGLVHHLEGLAPAFTGWRQSRSDAQALLGDADAVTISTWHRAKGLEWPITILFGLESVTEPSSYGVHVLTDRETFDLADPLGDRWVRCWPNPYGTKNQLGSVRSAYEGTAAHATLVAKAAREALRVLYVGWTRARDRLIFAAKRGKLLAGIAGRISKIDRTLFTEPVRNAAGVERMQWAGLEVPVLVAPCVSATPLVTVPEPGSVTTGRPRTTNPPARRTPSQASPVAASIGEIITLGPRVEISGSWEMSAIGDAIHAFLAADRPGLDDLLRSEIAAELLANHGVSGAIRADAIVALATRLTAWVASRFPGSSQRREWPMLHRSDDGIVVAGTADLVLIGSEGLTVIDHKSFPGTSEAAAERALGYSGQLAAYAAALRAATGVDVTSTWIHFPIRGRIVEVRLG